MLTRNWIVGDVARGRSTLWPLTIHSSGRYLIDARGNPFLIHADTCWSGAVQPTTSEIDTYLDNRMSKGFNALNVNLIEHKFSGQTPLYRNIDGNDPFTSMTDFAARNSSYWSHVDYLISGASARGLVVFAFPCYLGYLGGDEGWMTEVSAETDADLQNYGAFLAARYLNANVIWCMGGDFAGNSTQRTKQWNVATGLRSVRPDILITAHPDRADGDAHSMWSGYSGFNLNLVYTDATVYSEALTAYGRSGPLPFVMMESRYENNPGVTRFETRSVSFQTMLCGGCGWFYGNANVWGFGFGLNQSGSWTTALDDPGCADQVHIRTIFATRRWWTLVPDETNTVCTSGLGGTGTDRTQCAKASDSTFAITYVPAIRQVTIDMTEFNSTKTAKWVDPTNGAITTIGSYANSGSQNFTPSGTNSAGANDWVLVIE